MNDHIKSAPPPLARMYPYAPVQYENVVMKALEKNPDSRYQTVEEFGAALEHPESVTAWMGTAPAPPTARPTVMAGTRTSMAAGTAAAPAPAPAAPAISSRAQPAPSSLPMPAAPAAAAPGVAEKITWNSRYTAAAAIAGLAVILLWVLVTTRKPVAQIPSNVGTSPAATGNLPSLAPQGAASNAGAVSPLNSQSEGDSTGATKSDLGDLLRKPDAASGGPSRRQHVKEPGSPPAKAPPSAAGSAQNSAADTAALDEAEHQIDQLSSRAAAVNSSLDRLHQQQAASGYGMRGDIVSTQASMHNNLAKAQAAVGQGDVARAKRYASLAAADIEILERFLGR